MIWFPHAYLVRMPMKHVVKLFVLLPASDLSACYYVDLSQYTADIFILGGIKALRYDNLNEYT